MRTDWSIVADQVQVCASVQPFEIASIITVRVAAPTINRHTFIHTRLHNHRNGGRQPCSICTMRQVQISAYSLALGGPTVSKERGSYNEYQHTIITTPVHPKAKHPYGSASSCSRRSAAANIWTMVFDISSGVYLCCQLYTTIV